MTFVQGCAHPPVIRVYGVTEWAESLAWWEKDLQSKSGEGTRKCDRRASVRALDVIRKRKRQCYGRFHSIVRSPKDIDIVHIRRLPLGD